MKREAKYLEGDLREINDAMRIFYKWRDDLLAKGIKCEKCGKVSALAAIDGVCFSCKYPSKRRAK